MEETTLTNKVTCHPSWIVRFLLHLLTSLLLHDLPFLAFGFWGVGGCCLKNPLLPLSLFPFSPADGKSGSILTVTLSRFGSTCRFRWPSAPARWWARGVLARIICATHSSCAPLKQGHPLAPPFARHSCRVPILRRVPCMVQAVAGRCRQGFLLAQVWIFAAFCASLPLASLSHLSLLSQAPLLRMCLAHTIMFLPLSSSIALLISVSALLVTRFRFCCIFLSRLHFHML